MKKPSGCAISLKELITRVISDLEVTPSEYQQIMDYAHADGHIDKEEGGLLVHFMPCLAMGLSGGAVSRVVRGHAQT